MYKSYFNEYINEDAVLVVWEICNKFPKISAIIFSDRKSWKSHIPHKTLLTQKDPEFAKT